MDIAQTQYFHFIVFPGVFVQFCPYSWWDMWAHRYLVVVHHLTHHGINLVCRASFCIPDKYICGEGAELLFWGAGNLNTKTNKQTKTTPQSNIMQRIKSCFCCKNKLGQLCRHTQRHRQAEIACVTGSQSKREPWNLNSSCSSASALSHCYDSQWQCSR